MRKIAAILITTLFCTLLQGAEPKREEPSRHDKVYHFQHRVLPRWTFGSNGAFFADVSAGNLETLRTAATDLVDEDFGKAITARSVSQEGALLITFAVPAEVPECYFVLLVKEKESFKFVTLEMTEDVLNQGHKTALCEWTSKGSHLNRGPRTYVDAESFLSDALRGNQGEPAASFTPGKKTAVK